MTIEKYNEIKSLLEQIEKKQSELESVQDLINRLGEVNHGGSVHVKLAKPTDEWTYTPTAIMSYETFVTYLTSECARLETEIQALIDEFDNIEIMESGETNDEYNDEIVEQGGSDQGSENNGTDGNSVADNEEETQG